jgi:hypothetical protein
LKEKQEAIDVADDQVADKPNAGVKEPGTSSGNELASDKGREPGRTSEGEDGAGRPTGRREARDSTGINPQNEKGDSQHEIPPA